ncbi:MAG: hypothetical protein ABII82_09440 [Verrucomicrobiota bacterium]
MNRWLSLPLVLTVLAHPLYSQADTQPAASAPAVEDRLAEIETRLARIDRKFALLADDGDAMASAAFTTVLADPALLQAEARAATTQNGDLAKAYRCLATLRALHPEAAKAPESFDLAAALFRRLYLRERYNGPDSPWVQAEPIFMFQWLASLIDGDTFPQGQFDAFFIGLPYPMFRQFEAFAAKSPALSRWTYAVQRDNGIIESLEASPAQP